MSLAEIEAELDQLEPDELRRLALKSWTTFVEKEGRAEGTNMCDEDGPLLLAALDEALAKADATPGQGHTAEELRARIGEWTTR
jgi:myo-inositol-hexaphosphate 3-phosphohydrolase